MSAKHEAARQQIQRQLERGNDKEAYKQAKTLFRLDDSPTTRELLERAYVARIRALLTAGMQATAKETAEAFLAFGVKTDELLVALLPLLTQVGLGARALELGQRVGVPELQAQLIVAVYDQAVCKPAPDDSLSAEQRAGAAKVREALSAILAGDEERGAELLADVPRQSPLADWRLLARGLGAHLREDFAAADANWTRLQEGRAPYRIARALAARRAAASGGDDASTPRTGRPDPELDKLERQALGEPVTSHLSAVDRALDERDMPQFLRALKLAVSALRRTNLGLLERLTASVLDRFVSQALDLGPKAGQAAIETFMRTVDPLPIDPRWNRMWALVWTMVGPAPELVVRYWTAYLVDLDQIKFESPERRALAKALVYERIGLLQADQLDADKFSDDMGLPLDDFGADEDPTTRRTLADARRAIETSLTLRPGNRSLHLRLIDFLAEHVDPEAAAAAARKALDALPDDFEVADAAFAAGADVEDASLMLRAVEQARRLKPLDQGHDFRERLTRCCAARQFVKNKQAEQARRELERLETICTTPESRCIGNAVRAAVEYALKKDDAAARWISVGQESGPPAVFWFAFCHEAEKFQLKVLLRQIGASNLDAEMRKKKVGSVAAALARVAREYREFGAAGSTTDALTARAMEYAAKSSKAEFTEAEIKDVLELLAEAAQESQDEKALLQMSKRAVKLFPDSAMAHYFLGVAKMSEQIGKPRGSDRAPRKELELAAKLAARPGDPYADYLPRIRESLEFAKTAFQFKRQAMPFGFGGRGAGPIPDIFDFF